VGNQVRRSPHHQPLRQNRRCIFLSISSFFFIVDLIINTIVEFLFFQNVCEKLLNQGPLTLELIVRHTELSTRDVKNSLLVLIQHNCVQPFNVQGNSINVMN
jgi:DNA-directed RNA polymerase III subunit RPC3